MILENQNELNKFYTKIKRQELSLNVNKTAARTFTKTRDRMTIVNVLAMALTVAVCGRLIYLNTVKSTFLEKQLNTRVMRSITIPAMRGTTARLNFFRNRSTMSHLVTFVNIPILRARTGDR
jgi:hypothetical protein